MKSALAAVLSDDELATHLSRTGLRAVLDRHTCRHRAEELLAIIDGLGRFAHVAEIDARQERIAS